mmetsp:Transcript_12854/g.19277  ORF Transcript_12854/g.19277 Transcript_12854/m.19277 type:complete len:202 (-) Transcript_12854:586-1191(-)
MFMWMNWQRLVVGIMGMGEWFYWHQFWCFHHMHLHWHYLICHLHMSNLLHRHIVGHIVRSVFYYSIHGLHGNSNSSCRIYCHTSSITGIYRFFCNSSIDNRKGQNIYDTCCRCGINYGSIRRLNTCVHQYLRMFNACSHFIGNCCCSLFLHLCFCLFLKLDSLSLNFLHLCSRQSLFNHGPFLIAHPPFESQIFQFLNLIW